MSDKLDIFYLGCKMNLLTKKSRLSSKAMFLIGLPSEAGGILIGLILSSFHWVLFFVAPAVTVSLFQYVFNHLYKMEITSNSSVDKLFFCKIILLQLVLILCFFIIYYSIWS